MSEKKHKSSRSFKHTYVPSDTSDSESEGNESDPDMQDLKKALIMLTKAFHKKFFKKSSSNKLWYGSSSRRHDLQDKTNGGRGDINKIKGKNSENTPVCYNCNKPGHYARECMKGNVYIVGNIPSTAEATFSHVFPT